MSSEMRELVKEMRAGTPCYVAKVGGGRCVNGAECLRCAERLDWADRLERALLARTEAGAKCDHAWQPDSDVMNARYCPKCDVTQTIPKKTTHPKDASGDAEDRKARLVALRDEARKDADSPTHDEWDSGYACASGCLADKLTAILESKP